ncbi:MAG: tetratricopeptide repeat protein [Gammaproteobacteria bacterium]|nr:tetratricopeptide repeat protein [Gammaproteobacteria bacterium]
MQVITRRGAHLIAVFSLLVVGCSTPSGGMQAPHTEGQVSALKPTKREDSLVYNLLLGELAGRRGNIDIALESYEKASMLSQDPEVAERALQIALYSQRWKSVESTAKRWIRLSPKESAPHRVLLTAYIRQGNIEPAVEEAEKVIALSRTSEKRTYDGLLAVFKRVNKPDVTGAIAGKLVQADTQVASRHFLQARLAVHHGDIPLAEQAVRHTLALDPEHISALLLEAQLLIQQKRAGEGFKALEEALSRYPDNLGLRLGYARLLVADQQYDEAIGQIERLYGENSANGNLVFGLGLLAMESQALEKAEKYLNQAVSLDVRTSEAHLYLARIADNQKKYDKATAHYARVRHEEGQFEAQLRIAELMAAQGEIEPALTHLSLLRSRYSGVTNQVDFDLSEAEILRQAGRIEEALALLTRSLESRPENTQLRYMRALISDSAGMSEQFESDIHIVLEKEPKNAHALNALGYYWADKGIRLNEAKAYIEQAIALLPNDPAIIDSVGWIHYRLGNLEEALVHLRKAYTLLPEAEVAAHLGEVLWVMGKKAEARDVWAEALERSPKDKILRKVLERFKP